MFSLSVLLAHLLFQAWRDSRCLRSVRHRDRPARANPARGTLRAVCRRQIARVAVGGLLAIDAGLALVALLAALLLWLGTPLPVLAAPPFQGTSGDQAGGIAIGAALATGLAACGAGIGVGIAGAAAIGSIAEKPETLGRTLIFVGLAEGVAIYGLIISFMLLTQ